MKTIIKKFTDKAQQSKMTLRITAFVALFALATGFAGTASAQIFSSSTDSPITVTCAPSYPSIVLGTVFTFTAYPSGGTELYSYSWSGTDGLTGSAQAINPAYTTPGTKTATVTVTSGTRSATASCSINVVPAPTSAGTTGGTTSGNNSNTGNNQGVTVYVSQPTAADNSSASNLASANTSQDGVYLTQVPYTGPMDNWKLALYVISFFLWSAVISYVILKKKFGKEVPELALATETVEEDEFKARLESLRNFV